MVRIFREDESFFKERNNLRIEESSFDESENTDDLKKVNVQLRYFIIIIIGKFKTKNLLLEGNKLVYNFLIITVF